MSALMSQTQPVDVATQATPTVSEGDAKAIKRQSDAMIAQRMLFADENTQTGIQGVTSQSA